MNDPVDSTTWTFTYDRGGNMLEKRRYAYTTGELGECLETITYTYGDSNWKDKLTAYGGEPITYDALGNITSFNGYTYTWEHGRDLVAMTKGTAGTAGYHRMEFVYDEYGHRIQKTSITYDAENARNNYMITDFYWSGDKLVHSKVFTKAGEDGVRTEAADLHYHYDADGKPGIIRYNGTRFMCQYNLQGDIIGMIAGHHTKVLRYEYDAWGKQLSCTGSRKDDMGVQNPFRYRHYQYDDETGLYYLNSRYYSPELGRFISADHALMKPMQILENNLYAYCTNHVITKADHDGTDAYWINDSGGAGIFGHASLLLEDKDGKWYYFYWGADGKNFFLCAPKIIMAEIPVSYRSNGELDLMALNSVLVNKDYENVSPEKHRDYETAYHLRGDFSKSIEYIGLMKSCYTDPNSRFYQDKAYCLLSANCMQVSADVLQHSYIMNENWKMAMLFNDMKTYVIPNLVETVLEQVGLKLITKD